MKPLFPYSEIINYLWVTNERSYLPSSLKEAQQGKG
jgi:hypothetical protein